MRKTAVATLVLLLATLAPATSYAESCKDFIKTLVAYDKDHSDPAKDRYVWFVVATNQRSPGQMLGYMAGRLDFDDKKQQLRGNGQFSLGGQSWLVTNVTHKASVLYKAPDPPFKFSDQGLAPLSLSAVEPFTVAIFDVQIVAPQCADGVLFGWDNVDSGNPEVPGRTFYSISLNPMEAKAAPKGQATPPPTATEQPLARPPRKPMVFFPIPDAPPAPRPN